MNGREESKQSFAESERLCEGGGYMSLMNLLLILWAVLTTALIIVVIYRSTLTMHEEEQLFLTDSEAHMEKEQNEIHAKVSRLNPVVTWLGAGSGALILAIAGMWVFQAWNQF